MKTYINQITDTDSPRTFTSFKSAAKNVNAKDEVVFSMYVLK